MLIIRDGLDIIGPLKTDGEGSVYKARRDDKLLSAVKVLPQPLSWEKPGDEALNGTGHELSKLKKLGEFPHNNVVKVFNAGVSKSGESFYVEMDYIDGPDLEHLLKIPDHAILTITETLNLAEQLCNALDHCHKMDLVHGGVKLSNVKWNRHTGNYLLVDLGLSVLQDLQRSTRISKTENKDLAAPEEQAGKLFFQTDVFRFGILVFRLLAGTYPRSAINDLPSKDAQSKRLNASTELVTTRESNLPASWAYEKEDREKVIPGWLVAMVYKCLEADPGKRFANGTELRDYLITNMSIGLENPNDVAEAGKLRVENEKLAREKRELEAALQRQEFNDRIVHRQWKEINELVSQKEIELEELRLKLSRPALSGGLISIMVIVAMIAGAFMSYLFFPAGIVRPKAVMPPIARDTTFQQKNTPVNIRPAGAEPTVKQKRSRNKPRVVSEEVPPPGETATGRPKAAETFSSSAGESNDDLPVENDASLGEYKVKSKAYFHDGPDETSRRKGFIVHWNNAVLKPIVELESYIFVVFTNHLGQTSKGWLNKNDLTRIN